MFIIKESYCSKSTVTQESLEKQTCGTYTRDDKSINNGRNTNLKNEMLTDLKVEFNLLVFMG